MTSTDDDSRPRLDPCRGREGFDHGELDARCTEVARRTPSQEPSVAL